MTMTESAPTDDVLANLDQELLERGRQANMTALNQVKLKPQSVVTAPTSKNRVEKLFDQYAKLGYSLTFETLGYIELVARYNPDYSQAVENVRTLSNSGHDLFVTGTTESKGKKAKSYLEEQSKRINKGSGGIDGLIDKLLWQAAVFGAMCGEWILNEDLTEVIDFADINPKSIRFFWDDDEMYHGWAPYQEVKAEQAKEAEAAGQKVRNKRYVRLHPVTFRYYAFDPAPNNPYGTPPFISALRSISIQNDMVDNMSQIVKKMGLLGIVDMSIEPLQKNRGETDDQFMVRAARFLDQYVIACESMVQDGGLVHFNDSVVSTTSITGNAAGATNIFKQNEEQVFSGLKSMPSVQGRSYSTTETYAGVAYDIIIRNTWRYQRGVKRLIEGGYWLMLELANIPAEKIAVEFKPNKTLHRLQIAQAFLLEIKAALQLWATGVVDQNGFAQLLGFSDVKQVMQAIPETQILGNGSPGGGAGSTSTETGTEGSPPADSNAMADVVDAVDRFEKDLEV